MMDDGKDDDEELDTLSSHASVSILREKKEDGNQAGILIKIFTF